MPICTAACESSEKFLLVLLHSSRNILVCTDWWKSLCWLITFICCSHGYAASLAKGANNIETSSAIGSIREHRSVEMNKALPDEQWDSVLVFPLNHYGILLYLVITGCQWMCATESSHYARMSMLLLF